MGIRAILKMPTPKKIKFLLKKHKKGVIISVIISVTASSGAAMYAIKRSNIQDIVLKQQQIVKPVSDRIDDFEKRAVLRPDFNAYISRKDSEYHSQQQFNAEVQEKLGVLNGKIEEDDKILSRLSSSTKNC